MINLEKTTMKRQHRLTILVLVVVVLSFGMQSCNSQAKPQALPDLGTIKVGYLPVTGLAPFYIAVEKGYFEEQGLDVELQSFNSGSTMIAPLSTGQLDVGSGETGTALFNAISQGLEVRVVATSSSQPPGYSVTTFLVRKDLHDSGEITGPEDLKGRLVGVNVERGVAEYMVSEVLSRGDLAIDDVEMVTLPFPDMPAAFSNQALDAAYLTYPLATRAINDGDAVVLYEAEEIVDTLQNGVTTYGKRFLDPANREVAVRFMVALLKAGRDLYGDGWNNEENATIINKYTELPVETIMNSPHGYFDPNGRINTASTKLIQAYLISRGYTEYSEPLPMSNVIDDSYLEEALQRLGEFEE
jgi:NitT/TauT family transport system substrate-binding protein